MNILKSFVKAVAAVAKSNEARYPSLYVVKDRVATGIAKSDMTDLPNGRFGIQVGQNYIKAGLGRNVNPNAESFDLALVEAERDAEFAGSNGETISIPKGSLAFKLVESE